MIKEDKIIIYEKSTCSKCRALNTILDKAGVSYDVVLYHTSPISSDKLKELIKKMDIDIKQLIRTDEEDYKKLGLAHKNCTFDELVDILCNYPDLLQRPIVERGEKAILARPPEKIKELI